MGIRVLASVSAPCRPALQWWPAAFLQVRRGGLEWGKGGGTPEIKLLKGGGNPGRFPQPCKAGERQDEGGKAGVGHLIAAAELTQERGMGCNEENGGAEPVRWRAYARGWDVAFGAMVQDDEGRTRVGGWVWLEQKGVCRDVMRMQRTQRKGLDGPVCAVHG